MVPWFSVLGRVAFLIYTSAVTVDSVVVSPGMVSDISTNSVYLTFLVCPLFCLSKYFPVSPRAVHTVDSVYGAGLFFSTRSVLFECL